MSDVTEILTAIDRGQARADELLPLVYEELRKLAAARMAQESPGQTLQHRSPGFEERNWSLSSEPPPLHRGCVKNRARPLAGPLGGGGVNAGKSGGESKSKA